MKEPERSFRNSPVRSFRRIPAKSFEWSSERRSRRNLRGAPEDISGEIPEVNLETIPEVVSKNNPGKNLRYIRGQLMEDSRKELPEKFQKEFS